MTKEGQNFIVCFFSFFGREEGENILTCSFQQTTDGRFSSEQLNAEVWKPVRQEGTFRTMTKKDRGLGSWDRLLALTSHSPSYFSVAQNPMLSVKIIMAISYR